LSAHNRDPKPEKPLEMRPLHGGRHSLSPEVVAFNQRERLLAALVETAATKGYANTTIGDITAAASVSRRTFYEHFDDKGDCFRAAYDVLDEHLVELTTAAMRAETAWADRIVAILLTYIRYFAEHPKFARLYMIESVGVGEIMNERRELRAKRLIALLEAGRREASAGHELAEGLEEALAGGVITLLFRRVRDGEAAQLERFAAGLIEFILSPYLGPEAAAAIAGRHTARPTP
jgi:AcrR family transcriptional regulator